MKLSKDHKVFIVQRLASFDSPSEVIAAFRERYGQEVTAAQVVYYDPATAQAEKELAQEWKELFARTRAAYVENVADIPVAHKAVRLRRLDRMAAKAESKGNMVLAASLMEQAAKELGGAFTNKQEVKHSGRMDIRGVDFSTHEDE